MGVEGDISVGAEGGLSKATDKEVEAAAREEEEEEEEEVEEEGGSPWSCVPLEVREEEEAPSPCTPKRGQRSGPS